MLLKQKDKEVEINDLHWPLAKDLFIKWGFDALESNSIEVPDLDKITCELSAWGIPWKRTKWTY